MLIPIICLYIFTLSITSLNAQTANNNSKFISFLKNEYQNKFANINLDTFLINYGGPLGTYKFIERFAMFNELHLGMSTDPNKFTKLFYNVDITDDIKTKLPPDFFTNLLNSKEKNTQVLYLLLAAAIEDTAKIVDYLDNRVNKTTEKEARAFLNTMYSYSGLFYKNKIQSALLNKKSVYFFNYTTEYITPDIDLLINTSTENDNVTAGGEIDFFVYYKEKFKNINSQEKFIHACKSAYERFDEAVAIDIGIIKGFSFLPIIDKLLEEDYLSPKIKLAVLNYELNKAHSAEETNKLRVIFIKLYEKYCKLYTNIQFKESRETTPFDMHIAIIEMLCSSTNKLNDSLLNNLQIKLQYDWVLFKNIVKYQCKVNDSFFNTHFQILYNASNGLMEKQHTVNIIDTVSKITNRNTTINNYFPVNNHSPYYSDISSLRERDILFKKLMTTPEYSLLVDKFILSNKSLNDSLLRHPLATINNLIESSNPLKMAYGYKYLFTKEPGLVNKVLQKGNTSYKQKWVYYMAELFNYNDKKNRLAKYFNNSFSIGLSKDICNDKFDNAPLIHTALTYFKNRESGVFYSAITKAINDTANCIKISMFILNNYPYLLYNKQMNSETKDLYLQALCTMVKRKEWTDFYYQLTLDDLNKILKCYSRSLS